ncbi:nicotinate-nucleotide--dimethylbenzimidazole phosphoribosyltransferase [Streptomyces sp. TLI_171]|uniref:nicotinate-nucleotide--dimethylbenzimidazole phosphoribosyltransferase n=1 Tax=Streptomyces sp. TLI_171 TaxID=1938859 RepID=UPI000C198719|nr:nicotinate-nucleotide--dimethylbenzimidazole phosphoribosyltransferase [Streptomyces sp. TLI_171]RKE18084.1 nicotinate-nucleotide-dimethylbenzimidazole phosphoribosyltransferase /cob(II)yrinic acid a,c-diamide reductase [Streptomyces sp. TLI_171]
MTDGGHAPSAGPLAPEPGPGGPAPEHHLGAPLPPAAPAPAWHGEQRPAYTFLDQPDGDEDDDVLLMPGPQTAWGDAVHGTVEAAPAGEAPGAEQPAGTPVAPSWPPLAPPVLTAPAAEAAPGAPAAPEAPAADDVPGTLHLGAAQQPAGPQLTTPQPRRPLHAGPPIPDPSLMTGHVPVRSLADRGPSTPGGTPAYGVPVPPPEMLLQPQVAQPQQPAAVQPAPVAAPVAVQAVPVPAPVQPHVVEAAAALVAEPVAVAPVTPVAAEPVAPVAAPVQAPAAAGPVAVEPVAVEPVAPVSEPVAPVAEAVAPVAEPVAVEAVPVPAVPVAPVEAGPAPEVPAEPVAAPAADLAPVFVEPVEEAVAAQAPAAVETPAEPVPGAAAEPTAAEGADAPSEPQPEAVAVAVAEAADAPSEEPPAAGAETVSGEAVAQPIPAQPAKSGRGAHRRISAFLAAPAGLPLLEPEAPAAEAPVEAAEPAPEDPAAPEPPTAEAPDAPQAAEGAPAVEGTEPVEQAEQAGTAEAVEAEQEPTAEPAEVADVVDAVPAVETAGAEEAVEAVELVEAAEESDEERPPAAPGFDEAGREAVHQVIRERRDIRNGFRSDPIPHEVLIRVLEAAHTAPSVGYSQPWDFVVIRSAKTRRKMHELAERQREAFADSLPKGRAKQFKEIKIEAILETPVNIVVTADRTRGGRHTLGRHTQPQMAPYSAALAVENLWLAARAEGLGVGWVSFFDDEELVRELGLPEHLEVVAYLCVGFVDAFPDEPELQQQGWAKKRPLSWVVHEEQYGNRALPGEEPHDLLSDTLRGIRPLDAKALGEAWDRQKRMTKPAGSLGVLEVIAAQLSGLARKCPPPIPEPGCVAIFAGDHGVHAQGVTPWPQEVTAQMVGNFLAGGAVVNAFAAQVGTEVCVVDVGVAAELPDAIQQGRTTGLLPRKVKPGTDDMTQGPAMSRDEALRAIEVGIETARDLVAAGNKVLITGDMGIANTTASAALISVFTETDPAEVTGRGTGIDDATHARKVEVIRQALELHKPDPADPIGVLAAVGGLEHAAIAGFLLGAASLRTPVILDGVIAGSAALVAKAIAPEVLAACIAGHRSAEPGHQTALAKLGLRPLIDLDLRLGEGTGALLALPLVQSAARAMHDVATFDSAGVTEKA